MRLPKDDLKIFIVTIMFRIHFFHFFQERKYYHIEYTKRFVNIYILPKVILKNAKILFLFKMNLKY